MGRKRSRMRTLDAACLALSSPDTVVLVGRKPKCEFRRYGHLAEYEYEKEKTKPRSAASGTRLVINIFMYVLGAKRRYAPRLPNVVWLLNKQLRATVISTWFHSQGVLRASMATRR